MSKSYFVIYYMTNLLNVANVSDAFNVTSRHLYIKNNSKNCDGCINICLKE